MEISKEQVAARKKHLIDIVDDLFVVFEEIHRLLHNWKPYYHAYFMKQMWRLQQLESDLCALGYDEDFVLMVKKDVYRYFFGE